MATIGILGGTGDQGRGLGVRLAAAGHKVIVGSRSVERAQEAAAQLASLTSGDVVGADNSGAAAAADVVIAAVPYESHAATLRDLEAELDGKVLIDCVNALTFDRAGPMAVVVEAGSAAEEAARLLPRTRVVGAFHHISAKVLLDLDADHEPEDVLICGDDADAKGVVQSLASEVAGGEGVDVGPLRLARYLESFTAVILSLNKVNKAKAGLRVTGLS
jgi:NADPH-dependent F420 reductase